MEVLCIEQDDIDVYKSHYTENKGKLFPFQCLFCYEKFEVGPKMMKSMIVHYYSLHKKIVEQIAETLEKEADQGIQKYQKTNSLERIEVQESEEELLQPKAEILQNEEELLQPEIIYIQDEYASFANNNHIKEEEPSESCMQNNEAENNKPLIFQCKLCDKILATDIQLMRHLYSHKNIFVKCQICEDRFYLVRKCQEHLNLIHGVYQNVDKYIADENENKSTKFKCKSCFSVWSCEAKLMSHELTHEEPKFNCEADNCGKKFHTLDYKKRHMKVEHSIRLRNPNPINKKLKKILNCKECNIKFPTMEKLTLHEVTLHCTPGTVKCKLCENIFYLKRECRKHLVIHHNILKPYDQNLSMIDGTIKVKTKKPEKVNNEYICNICGKAFKSISFFKSHIDVHNGISYFCDYCGMQYTNKDVLTQHMKKAHLNIVTYTCKLCNKGYKDWTSLKYHTISVHTDVRPFECEHCDSSFISKTHLKVHTDAVHHNIKKFKCIPCDKVFKCTATRKSHNLKYHGINLTSIPLNFEES